MKSLTVQIPTPCAERWADMLPNEKGRFCAGCQKTVVDYSALSDRELVRVLSRSSGEICGQLRPDQLNRPLTLSTQEQSRWRQWLSILTMGVLTWQTAQAQSGPVASPARTTAIQPLRPLPIREAVPEDTNQVVVSGRLMFADSTGAVSVVPNATVLIKTIDPHAPTGAVFRSGTTTDTGVFKVFIPSNWPVDNLTLAVYGRDFTVRAIKVTAVSAATAIILSDVVLNEKMCVKTISITGGSLAIVKSPSRWQRLKRKLFHPAG